VHRVRLRVGGREVKVEVIVAEDGARPHVVTLPEPPGAAPPSIRKAPSTHLTPPQAPGSSKPAPSAARFDTQFE
jgi:hypothetical protein